MNGSGGEGRIARADRVALGLALALCTGASAPAAAQRHQLIVDPPNACSFRAPTAADFDAGYIDTTFSVTIDATRAPDALRWATVRIQSTSGTLAGGATPKPLSDLRWRLEPAGPWVPMSTTPALVRQVQIRRNGPGDPTAFLVGCRMLLSWAEPPRTLSYNVRVTLTISNTP